MSSKLGAFVRAQRITKGFTLGQLAREVGYWNIGKGTNRLHKFETTGEVHPDLLVKVGNVLGLDPGVVQELINQDHQEFLQEWNQWADEPIRPHLVCKVIPGVYLRRQLPDDALTPAAAEVYASGFAKDHASAHWEVCLVLSRRKSVWFDTQGQVKWRSEARPGVPNSPFMTLQGRRVPFLFGSKAGDGGAEGDGR